MNVLRNLFSSRTLSILRQNGQNAIVNITQPVDATPSGELNQAEKNATPDACGPTEPLLIPKGILDANVFKRKLFGPAPASISPTTVKKYGGMQRKVQLVYRCKICNTRNDKQVTEAAYSRGIVILQCDGCAVNHLIIDNLGWFADTKGKSFEEVLAANGAKVNVIKVNEHGELI